MCTRGGKAGSSTLDPSTCEALADPKRTLLGAAQEAWLDRTLSRAGKGWNIIGQQIMMGRLDRMPGPEVRLSMDKWDGYEVERARLLKFFAGRPASNPVVLAGDIHNNWVNDLHLEMANVKSPIVATEFVGTSVSTAGDGSDSR